MVYDYTRCTAVAQWIEHRPPEAGAWVRLPSAVFFMSFCRATGLQYPNPQNWLTRVKKSNIVFLESNTNGKHFEMEVLWIM